jgi:Family of unknown function (DUF6519)
MKGDFSRDTYHPFSQYSRVLMQQGRVQLDSDWNEQTSILLGYMRALTRDLFGPGAGPADACGFRIVTSENRASLPKDVAAQVDAALKAEKADLDDDDLLFLPGRYYVGGLPVEAERAIRYRAQAGFPFGEKEDSLRQRPWLAYLDVWEDFVSADQEPYIRETALNGVDSCGRARIRWQVRLLFDAKKREDYLNLPRTGSGRIKVRANPTEEADELCSITPDARYRGAENQLYRIEIHAGGKAGSNISGATFKWSRDNGTVAFAIRSGAGNRLTLAHLGRDEATTLIEGDWVEVVDDGVAEAGGVGLLAQVAKVDRDGLRVELTLPAGSPALPSYTPEQAGARHALLRRWDHRGDLAKAGGAIPVAEGGAYEMEIEDGVKVTFEEGGDYRPGDYWLIPARIATGDVEWPGVPDKPEFQLPHGPAHHYAPLGIRLLTAGKKWEFTDLRCCIARLPCIGEAKPAAPAAPTAAPATEMTATARATSREKPK